MLTRTGPATHCPNMNHKRLDPPVGHCPNCGGVVNANLRPRPCNEAEHAAARQRQMDYCVHCGLQLITHR
jgi:hypothetical protein